MGIPRLHVFELEDRSWVPAVSRDLPRITCTLRKVSRTASVIAATFVLTPFLVLLAPTFIRPFRWRRLFWTYLLLRCRSLAGGGVVSMLRVSRQ